MAEKSKILVIGGTGYMGKFIVEESIKTEHPTFALVRETSVLNPAKNTLISHFRDLGVNLLLGDLNDHTSLVRAIKQVDVVICLISSSNALDQTKIITAIKEAGNIKRFFPSEFGSNVDRTKATGLAKSAFSLKAQIRHAIEAEGVPYTYVVSNCFSGFFLPSMGQFQQGILTSPPTDKVSIFGDGNVKGIINTEEDIATYTIRAVDDPRTLNRVLYINCPENIVSMSDLVNLWEKKIGKTLEKIYVSEEQLLKSIEDSPAPINIYLSLTDSVFVKGDQTSFTLNPAYEVEASELYPDVKRLNPSLSHLNKRVFNGMAFGS